MWLNFVIALIPIAWLIIALGVIKMPATRATVIGLVLTGILAILFFKQTLLDTISGAAEGILMGLFPIIYVIVAALFTYNLTSKSGGLKVIQDLLSSITTDRRILVLIIAWGFGGFLEAIAGFGTAVAIPAGILIAFGVNPIAASVICLIANTTPTAFGAIGLPVITLAQVTKLAVIPLSTVVTYELLPLIVIIPFILVGIVGGGFKALKGVFWITLMSGLAFALPQVVVARFIGAELPAIVGSICSIAVTVIMAKLRKKDAAESQTDIPHHSASEVLRAASPFILVFILVILVSPLVKPLKTALDGFKVSFPVYTGKGASNFSFSYLSSPGTLIIVATILGGLIQKMRLGEIFGILGTTIKGLGKTTITVCSIVALAKIMGYSGMTNALAVAFVKMMGPVYPLIAPLIGAIGTFVTGSDTSANVLFGNLQLSAAKGLGDSVNWIVGTNMVGATAGKMISPQSIAVATAAIGQEGKEGEILKAVMKWFIFYLVIICVYLYLVGIMTGQIKL
ncbi:L-lactate permease [Lactobacillus corticis]|uniref:L-lactate permease n=1 Tax=Lactobacillus corticis TaxID=2201249 RepID=A0A916QIB5_9LACO|nr:L-lactate permease [Lactobacillus corticis]GFZ26843.1 L-lactate permease [Lactobacillus corticis]